MIVESSKHILCCLRNNSIIEGIVEQWSDEEVVLLSLDSQSRLIIQHPKQDIVFVKIVLTPRQEKKLPEIQQKIAEELKEVISIPEPELRNKSIMQLKSLVHDQERKIMEDRLKNHQLGQPRIVEYFYPGTTIKQSDK